MIGAPLAGRANPLRSVLGYVAVRKAHGVTLGGILVTREEFGDSPPALLAPGLADLLPERLRLLDSHKLLACCAVVLIGAMLAHGVGRWRLLQAEAPQARAEGERASAESASANNSAASRGGDHP